MVKTAMDNKLPLQVHCNGNAAIDMVIGAMRATGITAKDDRRTMIVHPNIQALDQLDSYVEPGLTPSCFTNHTFFSGDVHVMNFGKKRAFNLSPMNAARKKGLIGSNHTDFNITPLDPFFTMWTAMKRESRLVIPGVIAQINVSDPGNLLRRKALRITRKHSMNIAII